MAPIAVEDVMRIEGVGRGPSSLQMGGGVTSTSQGNPLAVEGREEEKEGKKRKRASYPPSNLDT